MTENQALENQFRIAIDAIPALVWAARADGSAEFFNRRWLDYTGLTLDQARDWGWVVAIHPDDFVGVGDTWRAIVASGEPGELEARLRRSDGEYRWFLARAAPQRDEAGAIVRWYGTNTDIEDRKRAELDVQRAHAELAHAMRVATLGEMAASIVHEVNQPITAIVANGDACLNWLRREPPDLGEVRAAVEAMVVEGNRTAEVVRRLRVLARKGNPQKELVAINDVIRESLLMVERELTWHGVTARTELAGTLPPALGDRTQLQQVIINLIMNGIDAMLAATNRPRRLLIRSERNKRDQVVVAVRDSGIGINPRDVNRLFDAFFTTKPDGLGMGLRVCRTIIEDHGGTLWASRNADTGATFQFSLPLQSRSVWAEL